MPTLSQVAANKAATSFKWGDLTFQIEYYPGKMTGNRIAEVEGSDDLNVIGTLIIDLLISWDLTEDDNVTMFPLDIERFGEIGVLFLMAVFQAMTSDMRPEVVAPQKKRRN